MDILISDAVLPVDLATEISAHISPQHALRQVLKHATHQVERLDQQQGCSSSEAVILNHYGYTASANSPLLDVLPFLSLLKSPLSTPQTQPLALLELCHFEIDQQHSGLIPAKELHISNEHRQQLFTELAPLLAEKNITVYDHRQDRWLISLPDSIVAAPQSSAKMASQLVHEYWPKSAQYKGLRVLLNEIQMQCFQSAVNQARHVAGLPAINSAWIFGKLPAHIRPDSQQRWHTASYQGLTYEVFEQGDHALAYIDVLEPAFRKQDWGAWLQGFNGLSDFMAQAWKARPHTRFIFTGPEELKTLTRTKPWGAKRLLQTLNKSNKQWNQWWLQSF
ncbi:hypothetical protein [Brackiella oedipodis]|uniref:hypothetical protein n=1 Tax=Brackiella oedipodis TaxID=124225 RepID=UPI0004921C14|nr:hypothetical protein [Brackiella oedipodis]